MRVLEFFYKAGKVSPAPAGALEEMVVGFWLFLHQKASAESEEEEDMLAV